MKHNMEFVIKDVPVFRGGTRAVFQIIPKLFHIDFLFNYAKTQIRSRLLSLPVALD